MKITRFALASVLGMMSLGLGACNMSQARWRMAKYEVRADVPESLTTGKPSTGPVAAERRRQAGLGGNLEPRSREAGDLIASSSSAALPPLPLEFSGPELVNIPKPDELTGMPSRLGSPELLMMPQPRDIDADPDLPNSGPAGDTGVPGLLPPPPDGVELPALTEADVTPPELTPIAPAAEPEQPAEEYIHQGPPAPESIGTEPTPAPEETPAEVAPATESDAMDSLISVLMPHRASRQIANRGPLGLVARHP